MKKLTICQSTILRMVAAEPNQQWIPYSIYERVENQNIVLDAVSLSKIVPALCRRGLVEPLPSLRKYACKLTELGKKVAEQEKGKPLAFVSSL